MIDMQACFYLSMQAYISPLTEVFESNHTVVYLQKTKGETEITQKLLIAISE